MSLLQKNVQPSSCDTSTIYLQKLCFHSYTFPRNLTPSPLHFRAEQEDSCHPQPPGWHCPEVPSCPSPWWPLGLSLLQVVTLFFQSSNIMPMKPAQTPPGLSPSPVYTPSPLPCPSARMSAYLCFKRQSLTVCEASVSDRRGGSRSLGAGEA